jgi:hypothetical protein
MFSSPVQKARFRTPLGDDRCERGLVRRLADPSWMTVVPMVGQMVIFPLPVELWFACDNPDMCQERWHQCLRNCRPRGMSATPVEGGTAARPGDGSLSHNSSEMPPHEQRKATSRDYVSRHKGWRCGIDVNALRGEVSSQAASWEMLPHPSRSTMVSSSRSSSSQKYRQSV